MVLTDPPLAARDTPRICTRYPEADCTRYPEPAPNRLRGYPHIWCRAWLVARTPPAVRSPPMGEVLQLELFRVTAAEPPWRDNRDAMEYPFLSLQKKRVKPIRYAKDDVSVSVYAPAEFGLASIWDWDLVIFAASHLNDCLGSGLKPAPRIAFVPYDCLRQLCRHTGGKDYRELAELSAAST